MLRSGVGFDASLWRLRPVNAAELLESLVAEGVAREVKADAGATRAVRVAGVELAVAKEAHDLRTRWKRRVGSASVPYLLVADHPEGDGLVAALGPNRHNSPIRLLNVESLLPVMERAAELDSLDAVRHVDGEISRLDQSGIAGLKVRGLLTMHTLDVRLRGDSGRWGAAAARVESIVSPDYWRAVLTDLGYKVGPLQRRGWLARHNGEPVAVIHPKASHNEFATLDADGRPPEGVLIGDCRNEGARYGLIAHGGRFRLFDAGRDGLTTERFDPDAGRDGSTTEWLDIDAELLSDDDRPFLALLAPEYLAEGGLAKLQAEAQAFGAELRMRLDRTIRQEALPALAAGVDRWAAQQGIDTANDNERLELERASLTLLFRLLFILYAEGSGFLPMSNHDYRRGSLSSLVDEAERNMDMLSVESTGLWGRSVLLVRAMRSGNPAWEVPAYNGALFADRGFDGAETLERLELADPDFGAVLAAVGHDPETGRGVDYSTLEIGHLGHIYEALLSLRLSVADRPLRYDASADRFRPTETQPDIEKGGLVWLTNEGGRKSGGVYYTRAELVKHIVDRSVLRSFERHLDQVAETAAVNPREAAAQLLEFTVLDPACGSAHFLVQVVEALANRTVLFLAETPLPEITRRVDDLRRGASSGVGIDDVLLLRRLLLKHCVFGVDVSPMGAEVATLSLWLGSFVPGLSLAYLGRNVLVGNSLIGVADPAAVGDVGGFFDAKLRSALAEATRAVVELADIHDRTPDEYAESEKADSEARAAVEGLGRLFDLWTAEGFGLVGARQAVELHGSNVIDGTAEGDIALLVEEAEKLGERHRFLHWPLAFPQVFSGERPGFDVVVGNPPWEEIDVERLGFFALHRPGLRSLPETERKRAITELLADRPELDDLYEAERERASVERKSLKAGGYESMAGDPDLYKFFCQRYARLVSEGGRLGVVLPGAAFVNKGSEGFREWLFEKITAHRVDFLLNTGRWIFDIHPQKPVALVGAERATPSDGHMVEVAGTATSLDEWGRQSAGNGLRLLRRAFGPGWITPRLRSQAEADVLAKTRVGSPFPTGSGGRWSCFPVRELDESKDKSLWGDGREGRPLWKGGSFDQYDPHGKKARLCPESDEVLRKVNKPRPGSDSMLASQISVQDRRDAVAAELERARVVFRDVTHSTNSRTVIACLVPPGVFLTNKAPYLTFVEGNEQAQAACLAIMNSLPFDWRARRFVENNLNFFLLEGLVTPNLDDEGFGEIVKAAGRLSAVDERFGDFARAVGVEVGPLDDAERTRLRIEIDARVARSWRLSADDLRVMFSDFTTNAVPEAYRSALIARLEELG